MFGETQAISTVKPVSQNYASATGSARVVQPFHFWTDSKYPQTDTADFHKDGYILQNAGNFQRLTNRFEVVCDVNSEYLRIQVYSLDFKVFSPYSYYTNLRFSTQIRCRDIWEHISWEKN